MSNIPKTLEETKLWQVYITKNPDSKRSGWVKNVFDLAVEHLKAVRDTFPNYTLHDSTHVINVIYAMGAVLGDQIKNLSLGEIELLILSASLHDVGMVYNDDERQAAFKDTEKCTNFLKEQAPELIGCLHKEWSVIVQQNYLRSLHPFRINEILERSTWKKIFDSRPPNIIHEKYIVAVCEAHGLSPDDIMNNDDLRLHEFYDIDTLFIAILLRLGDILDFDDSRSPAVLADYADGNTKSVEEWRKHMSSKGFMYPDSPSKKALAFSAECTEPGLEHSIRDFLKWIEDELLNCAKLQRLCVKPWQRTFQFPCGVDTTEITRHGYVSDEFSLTMDQVKILNLLTGENLYQSNFVFVRELLQNAIDATLLRGKMDSSFKITDARIDLWEWNDREGNLWFRIDDRGTGMTLGMLQRYFLKVGNSYYTSKELTRDLRSHNCSEDYIGISRFGIGFLSCFLCGICAHVSTRYFDNEKNLTEGEPIVGKKKGFGLRIDVTGLKGYFTVRSQAEGHIVGETIPFPEDIGNPKKNNLELNGYRLEPGTSITVKLDSGKLDLTNLREVAESYICGTRMPIYYNGKRLGRTYDEIMDEAHRLDGERIYELSDDVKQKFSASFPYFDGAYPTIRVKVFPLDSDVFRILPGFSGVVVNYDVKFKKRIYHEVNGQTYEVRAEYIRDNDKRILRFFERNTASHASYYFYSWERLEEEYGTDATEKLKNFFANITECPTSSEQLGALWSPFADKEDLATIWTIYLDSTQINSIDLSIDELKIQTLQEFYSDYIGQCYFNGVLSGNIGGVYSKEGGPSDLLLLLENRCQPLTDMGRSTVKTMPLEVYASVFGIIHHPAIGLSMERLYTQNWERCTLAEWRELRCSFVGAWLRESQKDNAEKIMNRLANARNPLRTPKKYVDDSIDVSGTSFSFLYSLLMTYFQDTYDMSIDYNNGQAISFEQKNTFEVDHSYDLFPPMMFCRAKDKSNARWLCSSKRHFRRGITLDHPFSLWLVRNAPTLNRYFKRQFMEIVWTLKNADYKGIIDSVNTFQAQLINLYDRHNLDLNGLYPLTKRDFWFPDK